MKVALLARSVFPIVGLGALGRRLADLLVAVGVGAGAEAALEVMSSHAPALA